MSAFSTSTSANSNPFSPSSSPSVAPSKLFRRQAPTTRAAHESSIVNTRSEWKIDPSAYVARIIPPRESSSSLPVLLVAGSVALGVDIDMMVLTYLSITDIVKGLHGTCRAASTLSHSYWSQRARHLYIPANYPFTRRRLFVLDIPPSNNVHHDSSSRAQTILCSHQHLTSIDIGEIDREHTPIIVK
jgi:hypothetical protein